MKELKQRLEEKNPGLSEKVAADLPFQVSRVVERNRMAAKITQVQLARKLKTKQSGISRLERGTTLPSLTLLQRVAKALGMYVKIDFVPFKSPQS